MNSQVCTRCNVSKCLAYFHKDSGTKSGYYPICKECRKGIISDYYARNKEKVKAYQKEYIKDKKECIKERRKIYASNNVEKLQARRRVYLQSRSTEQKLWRSARDRSAKFNRDFSITVNDIHIPAICPILGIPLYHSKGQPGPNSPSLDRIDSSKGYIPGNIKVISFKANALKSDFTIDDLKSIVKYMEGS